MSHFLSVALTRGPVGRISPEVGVHFRAVGRWRWDISARILRAAATCFTLRHARRPRKVSVSLVVVPRWCLGLQRHLRAPPCKGTLPPLESAGSMRAAPFVGRVPPMALLSLSPSRHCGPCSRVTSPHGPAGTCSKAACKALCALALAGFWAHLDHSPLPCWHSVIPLPAQCPEGTLLPSVRALPGACRRGPDPVTPSRPAGWARVTS